MWPLPGEANITVENRSANRGVTCAKSEHFQRGVKFFIFARMNLTRTVDSGVVKHLAIRRIFPSETCISVCAASTLERRGRRK